MSRIIETALKRPGLLIANYDFVDENVQKLEKRGYIINSVKWREGSDKVTIYYCEGFYCEDELRLRKVH